MFLTTASRLFSLPSPKTLCFEHSKVGPHQPLPICVSITFQSPGLPCSWKILILALGSLLFSDITAVLVFSGFNIHILIHPTLWPLSSLISSPSRVVSFILKTPGLQEIPWLFSELNRNHDYILSVCSTPSAPGHHLLSFEPTPSGLKHSNTKKYLSHCARQPPAHRAFCCLSLLSLPGQSSKGSDGHPCSGFLFQGGAQPEAPTWAH